MPYPNIVSGGARSQPNRYAGYIQNRGNAGVTPEQYGFNSGMPPTGQNGMPPSNPTVQTGMPPQGDEMPPNQHASWQSQMQNGGVNPETGLPWGQHPQDDQMPPEWSSADPTNPYSPWSTMPPTEANYDQMQGFADQAYDYSRRYVDPQQEQDQRRLDQELINRGIDPQSAQGMEMMDQMSMRHGDQNDASAFGAMQFGQGIQDQMFNQQLGWGGLELGRQAQDFSEVLGYDQMDYRNNQFNEMNNRWDQGLAMQMAGFMPPYGGGGQGMDKLSGNSPLTPWGSWIRDMWDT